MSRITGRDVDDLREILREQVVEHGDRGGCYTTDVLWESAIGELAPDEERRLILHLGVCSACATSWELARELASPLAIPDRVPHSTRRWPWLAAAAAFLVLLIGLGLWQPRQQQPAVYRDTSGDWLRSALAEAPLPRDACVLRWSSGPPGTTYDVDVTAADLRPLTRGFDLTSPGFRVEPRALADVDAGEEILWRVTARLPDGSLVASTTFRTRVE